MWRFIQDRCEGCASVFDVQIQLAGFESLVDEERAAKVGLANDGDTGASFDVLGEELGEDDLLGEEFGADGDFGLRGFVASGEEIKEAEEVERAEDAAHVRRKCSWEKKKFSTEVAGSTEDIAESKARRSG